MKIEMRVLVNAHTPEPYWEENTFDMKPGDTLEFIDKDGKKLTLAAHPGKYVELDAEEMYFLRSCIAAAISEGQGETLDKMRTLALFRKLGVSPTAWYYQLEVGRNG